MTVHVVDATRRAVLDGDATIEYGGPHGPLTGTSGPFETRLTDGRTEIAIGWGQRSRKDRNQVAALKRGIPVVGIRATVAQPQMGVTRHQRGVEVTDGTRTWAWREHGWLFWARTRFERADGSVVAEVRFGNRLAVDDHAAADEVRLAVICWAAWLDARAQPINLVPPV